MQSNKHHLLLLVLLFSSFSCLFSQEDKVVILPIKSIQDSIIAPTDYTNILIKDSTTVDSTQIDSLNKKPTLLLDKIKYRAKDYVKLSQKDQKIYLYNEAEIYYQDTELKAGIIIMDYIKNEVYAGRIKDSLGNYTQLPYFKQGGSVVIPDSIRFNFDTKKALIWNSRTEQEAGLGELGSDAMNVYAEITKKENDSVYFLNKGRLTTSKDTVNPDYYILVNKAKFVPKKKVIAGFSNMYIADVPTPLFLPFAYFPMSTGRTGGLIFPTFGNIADRGYFLQNGGYYLPIGEYADLEVTGDLYTNGSYGLSSRSVYAKRYKFRGGFNVQFQNIINSQKGFDDYSRSTNYNIQWNHSQDQKSNPNSSFSASVNLGSSQYYINSLRIQDISNTQNNTLSSSISYSKTFPEYPSVNMSLTASHSQLTSSTLTDTDTDNITMTLPTFQASMERIYPFAKRDGIKKGLIQNINFQYDVTASNSLTTNDDDFLSSRMFDNAKVGARHRIPLSTNFKVAKYLSVTVGGTYEDLWTLDTYRRAYDETTKTEIITDTIKGFDRFNKYNFTTSIGTTIYGTLNLGEDKKIQAIRHVVRPSISYGYTPSFDQFYEDLLNSNGEQVIINEELQRYTRFEGTLNGSPSLSKSNSLSFSLANTLEAKVRSKDSTETEAKKIQILRNLNFSTGYNFNADSLKLSPISFSGGTSILKNKMSINFAGTLDPYAIDNNGTRINTFNIDNGGSWARLTNARGNISYSFSSKDFDKKNDKDNKEEDIDNKYDYNASSGGRTDDLFGDSDFMNQKRPNDKEDEEERETGLYSNKIPWDLRLAYTVSYSNPNRENIINTHSLMFSGNIELTPKLKVGASSGYDFVNKGFSITQLRFQRELGSFNVRLNWTPFGLYERWDFFIGISSSILSDLKWDKQSTRSLSRQ
ncbi:LPS-assembly protein LptD [Cellulophaga sp. HaHaR_3_176]|uniref:putative LPS assembly protein LptD n=1 Tax=Cellulophaga sp. HaHaR_3_176 TaxID=1942464 RepID=UPI001C1F8AFA|nr:putative LPS assembly protein LptD [Cellulophaga sp. HaHaR_3_176]QWX84780.1 LPS-assembly protein LptD [Cellulophaga sp. HaHaR_3_176]